MTEEPPLPDAGAASALRAIEQEEVYLRKHRDDCLAAYLNAQKDSTEKPREKDGTDLDLMESIAKRHYDDAEELLTEKRKLLQSFDKTVAPEKRDAGEKMTREEVSSFLSMLAVVERSATESLIHNLCSDILSCRTPQDVYKLLAEKLRECKRNAISSAVREGHMPKWVADKLEGVV